MPTGTSKPRGCLPLSNCYAPLISPRPSHENSITVDSRPPQCLNHQLSLQPGIGLFDVFLHWAFGYLSKISMRLSLFFCALSMLMSTAVDAQDVRYKPTSAGVMLHNSNYLVDFNTSSGTAWWVHYELLSSETYGGASRTDDFRLDRRISGSSPSASAYRGSGYDRGHLKPAADSKSSLQEMSNSFLMTNMVPQTPSLNRGVWRSIEGQVRGWARHYGKVYVTTGPSPTTLHKISGRVSVPAYCWKAVLHLGSDTSAIAFLTPNLAKVQGGLHRYVLSVDDLESRLGIDLFPGLPDATEQRVEAQSNLSLWQGVAPPVVRSSSTQKKSQATQCSGIAKSTGVRCRNKTTHVSGRCHHHRH